MRVTFFCFAKRKSPKKRRPPVCDPFAVRRGKPAACRLRGAPQNSLRAGALRSDNCGESVHEARALRRACSPRNRPAAGAASRGWTAEHPNNRTAEHPFGPSLRSAWPAQRVAPAPARCGRAKQRPVWMFCPLCPLWMRRGAQGLADQGSRLSERSETERVRARPRQTRAPQVAPKRSAGDADSGVAFLLGTFLWRSKEKCLACRATPGLRPPHWQAICFQINSK